MEQCKQHDLKYRRVTVGRVVIIVIIVVAVVIVVIIIITNINKCRPLGPVLWKLNPGDNGLSILFLVSLCRICLVVGTPMQSRVFMCVLSFNSLGPKLNPPAQGQQPEFFLLAI
jgi:hypothetical protein